MMEIIMYDNKQKTLVQVSENDVLTRLYLLEIDVPTKDTVLKYTSGNKNTLISKFFKNDIDNKIRSIRESLSRIDNKIPLYDMYTENLYLVGRKHIYERVVDESYRFPSQDLLNSLEHRKTDIEGKLKEIDFDNVEINMAHNTDINKINKEMYRLFQYGKMLKMTHRKIGLCLNFMKSFDLQILYNTYVNTIYSYSNQLGKKLTICRRPSFAYQFKHITPYYTRSEIINMGLNMGIIKDDSTYYTDDKISSLCKIIGDNDIRSQVLLDHQIHIIKNKMIGMVQYYSLQGSYFMNQYLRGQVSYSCRSDVLEMLIKPMWQLILNAPSFDKRYIVYRFVQTDEFLSSLKTNDTYIEKGFMSTTRDPFYQNKEYKFGWILLKIKLPENIKGCALCIEPVSMFHNEQEIILPPNTHLKLLRKDDESIYYHTDKSITKQVRTMYEFEMLVDKNPRILMPERTICQTTNKVIDFLKIDKTISLTIEEKISRFINKHVNATGYFKIMMGDKEFDVKSEWYDSSGVYRDYYATQSKNGYSLYSLYNNHLIFIIELGEQHGIPHMYVNYNVKYSTSEREQIIGTEHFVSFIASVAYYFDIPNVIIYADYVSCDYMIPIDDEHKYNRFYGGTYCSDFYNYIKTGKKKYADVGVLNVELIPKFYYHQLDVLKKTKPMSILSKKDERNTDDRVYQLYNRVYKPFIPDINDTCANFYVWVAENHCYILGKLIDKFTKIPQYSHNNPFTKDYYVFNPMAYLYNRGRITGIPVSINELNMENIDSKSKSGSMNRYRIVEEQRRR